MGDKKPLWEGYQPTEKKGYQPLPSTPGTPKPQDGYRPESDPRLVNPPPKKP